MPKENKTPPFPLNPDPRLIYEACNQLGWPISDPAELAQRIRQLDSGLPAEDEFSLLISWLGNCEIVHKLDQDQSPPESKAYYRIPDLFAVFRHGDHVVPVLIEVKVSYDKDLPKLSWKPDYLDGFRRYAKLLNLPLLIAWKWKTGGFWTLFDSERLELAIKNYNISFGKAMMENLLSELAGDFHITFRSNVGFHLKFTKDKKLESIEKGNTRTEKWLMTIKDAFFTNGKMERVPRLGTGLWALFLCSDMEETSEFSEFEVKQSFSIKRNSGQFAHRMLPILIQWRLGRNKRINWRKIRANYSIPIQFKLIREAAIEGIKAGIVQYVLDPVPNKKPDFY